MLKIHHHGCRDHGINTAGNDMERVDEFLKELTDAVQACHRAIRGSNKLSAALANAQINTTRCKLALQAQTRWNSKAALFLSHDKAKGDIAEVVASDLSGKVSDETIKPGFISQMNQHTKYLEETKATSTAIQKRNMKLEEVQEHCQVLAEAVESGKGKPGDVFEHCRMVPTKFSEDCPFDTNKHYLTGTIKLQRGLEAEMNSDEHEACKGWEVVEEEKELGEDVETPPAKTLLEIAKERRERHRMASRSQSNYVGRDGCRHFDAAGRVAAEPERLWSAGDAVLTKRRANMQPLMFEMIMYLKFNKRLWGLEEVVEANLRRKNDSRAAKARAEMLAQRTKVNERRAAMEEWADYHAPSTVEGESVLGSSATL